ncbi:MAG: TIGR02221 family CRISPR-associated protein [Candidatus Marinimicrobia bacterium]|nr:TIGR02221 family CRISPR-associated protein [Candidatus Neomarinimicrobiota bacterium]
MSTTLISFIGTGWRKKESGRPTYDTASYDFGDNNIVKSSMFFNAILRSKKYTFKDTIIIGTKTSAWGTLIGENNLDNYEDLYIKLETEFDEEGINSSTLLELEKALKEIWKIPIKCVVTPSQINDENAFDILSVYFEQIDKIENDNILLDITHGFRSMPVLLMSALQFNETMNNNSRKIDIIYGELKKGENSPVRYLDAIWKEIDLSQSANAFFQKFDATDLSEKVEPFWPSGSKAILQIASSLQGNFIIGIREDIRQLNNALIMSIDSAPKWFPPIKRKIKKLYKKLNSTKTDSELCFVIASMFAERKMYGQAIISLQLSFEAYLFDYFKIDKSKYGDFDETKRLKKRFHSKSKINKNDKKQLWNLEVLRNTIAHGGSKNKDGGSQKANYLPKQFDSYKKLIMRVIK